MPQQNSARKNDLSPYYAVTSGKPDPTHSRHSRTGLSSRLPAVSERLTSVGHYGMLINTRSLLTTGAVPLAAITESSRCKPGATCLLSFV